MTSKALLIVFGICMACVTFLIAVFGGIWFYGQQVKPQPLPGPSPLSNYSALAQQAIAGDQSGLADEYLAAGFAKAADVLASPAAQARITDRKQFQRWIETIGQLFRDDLVGCNASPIILQAFGSMEKAGPFTDADRTHAIAQLRAIGVAFDGL